MNARRPSVPSEASKPESNVYGNNHGTTDMMGPAKIPYCYAQPAGGEKLSTAKTDRADGTSRHDLHEDIPATQINRFRSKTCPGLAGKWSEAEKASY